MPVMMALLGLAGCTAYAPKPLDLFAKQPKEVLHLKVDARSMPLPSLASHRFNPDDGLDITEVAMLAVANNPELKVARDDAGVAHAQAFAAGLLPDPQVSLAGDFPQNGGPGNTSAFSLGLGLDLRLLVTRAATIDTASAEARKTDLNLLWQEWQVVGRARQLFVQAQAQQRQLEMLKQGRILLEDRLARARRALVQGNATLAAESADLAALDTADKNIADLARQANATRLDLNALLGLDARAQLTLVGAANVPPLDAAVVEEALADLARRRPDLLALQAGYAAQEARVRAAILAQFPAIGIGISRARDTSNLYTEGFSLTLTLPIFNRNRGGIAVASATRQRLYDEFEARLVAAQSQARRLLGERRLLETRLEDVRRRAAELERTAANARAAYAAGNLDERSYIDLEQSLLERRLEIVSLQQSLREGQVALSLVIGGESPAKISDSNEKGS